MEKVRVVNDKIPENIGQPTYYCLEDFIKENIKHVKTLKKINPHQEHLITNPK